MAQEIVGVKIEVDGSQVGQSVGSLKKQLREAQAEVVNLSDKFGATSKEAIQAAKRAAELRDRIGDAKALTDAFNPDAKFKAFGQALTGVAGGFAAVQGAIGLFGDKSAEVEQTLLKVQSALAFSQGIEQLGGLKDSLTNVAAVVKSQVVGAFSTLKGAIIATGIGALGIALALVVANFDKVSKAVNNLFPGLGKLAKFVGGLVQDFTDWIGVTSEQERALDKLNKTTERTNEDLDAQIKLLQAQGGQEGKVFELTKKRNENELNLLRERLKTTGKLTEEETKRFRQLKNEQLVLDAAENKRLNDAAERTEKENRDRQTEANKKELERRNAELDAEKKLTQEKGIVQADFTETVVQQKTQQFERLIRIDEKAANAQIENNRKVIKTKNEDDIKAAKAKQDLEIALAQQTLQIVGGIIDQNSAAGKAVSVAQAIINTYQGASKAIAQGGIVGPIAAAATIAAGLVQVKKIISTKIPSATGQGSVSGGGDARITALAAAPIGIQAPQAQITQLNQQSINQLGSATNRAYVVESDITNSQERVARLNRAARIG